MHRRWNVLGTVLVLLALAACDSGRLGAPLGPRGTAGGIGGGSGGGSVAAGVVGTWQRILYFLADDGSASSTETTWRFNADGTASRLSVTRNFTAGLADAQTVDARWEGEFEPNIPETAAVVES